MRRLSSVGTASDRLSLLASSSNASELGLSVVIRHIPDAIPAAELDDLHGGFRFFQHINYLLLRESILHA
jgi:hypothetical protein